MHGLNKLEEASDAYTEGLKYDPDNAQLKKGLEDVSASSTNPIASIFAGDVFAKIAANPKLSPFLAQPDLVEKIRNIQANPNLINMYMQDPRMMQVMIGLMGIDANVGTASDLAEQGVDIPSTSSPTTNTTSAASSFSKSKQPEPEPEPEPEMTDEEKSAKEERTASDKEKDLGNQMYKKRKFEEALTHYSKAWDLDESNVAVLTNKSGKTKRR